MTVTEHFIALPQHIIDLCIDFTLKHQPIKNQYTSHGIENRTAEDRALDKMCEFAFAQWAGVDPGAISFGADGGTDVDARGILVDIKSCSMSKQLLCWPFNKIKEFDAKVFDRLVLVKHGKVNGALRFKIVGWITKKRFRRERIVATGDGEPRLTKETRYVHQDALNPMETFFDHLTDAERAGHQNGFVGFDNGGHFVHYCSCGRDAGHGYDVMLRKGQFGNWFCKDHRPGVV